MSLSEIEELLEEYFEYDTGLQIPKHLDIIDLFKDIFVTKRSLKHVIEQRKKDNYDLNKIKLLFNDLHKIIEARKYILVPNKRNSKLLIEYKSEKGTLAVAVIEKIEEGFIITTAFYRSTRKLNKYFKNKKV